MRPDEAREFVASHHRAVLITRRSGGGLQTSPVLVGVDDEGKVLCVLSDDFFGRWIQIEGTAQVVSLRRRWMGWSTTTGASAGSIPTG
jgi:hypothetical protein